MSSPPTSALLAASNLGKRHPRTAGWLFRQIDLDVAGGDRLALVGPTGSGKSLILRAIALLDPVDQGEISWRGQPITDAGVPDYRAQVIYLQQRSPVIEGTVEDNLEFPFTLQRRRGSPLPRARLEELLASLGRGDDFLASRTADLSGGERQLVALLRALLVTPLVLLLDEPSAALDPQATAALERLVDAWQREAPTERAYVWVSHDATQAQRVADRVIHLRQGSIEVDR